MAKHKVLYLAYDGMTDPLGQSQVLSYLKGIASRLNVEFYIVSVEKNDNYLAYKETIAEICKENNIRWHPLSYTKKPPILSTLYDMFRMYRLVMKLYKKVNFDIVHCRSYVTSIIGLKLKQKFNTKFIFDMRGFFADERVDGKIWDKTKQPYKAVYNYFKRKEKQFLAQADAVVSLTYRGKDIIEDWRIRPIQKMPVQVIPCCVDDSLFNQNNVDYELQSQLRKALDLEGKFVLTYLGSIGTWYMLDEMLDFFKAFKKVRKDAVFFFISGHPKDYIQAKAMEKGIAKESIQVTKADYNKMPTYLSLSHASVFFIIPCFSKLASSPVKQGELMSMGIPIVCNSNVGDTDKIIRDYSSGILVDEFSSAAYERAVNFLQNLDNFDEQKTRHGAEEYFGLERGISSYSDIYRQLLN